MTTEPISPLEISKMVNKLSACAEECWNDKLYHESLDYIQSAITLDPYNHILHYKKGQILNEMDCLHSALVSLNKCLELLPSYTLATEGIAVIEKKIARRYTMGVYK